jgi:DNA invertase Pin-like site-specific DNA recombinase
MDKKSVRIGIYARISDDRDGQQTATARQLEDCRAFAAKKGWEVADEFEDIEPPLIRPTSNAPSSRVCSRP